MGLFNKLKDMFYYEEEEIIEESGKEEITKEKTAEQEVVKEDEMDSVVSERDLFKSEPTFKFPIMFEAGEIKNTSVSDGLNVLEVTGEEKVEVGKESFKPSPVVSPIFGVMGEDYQKEDIKSSKTDDKISFESFRNKAYGTLQDDLEKTMSDETLDIDKNFEDFDTELEEEEVSLDLSKITIGDAEENFEDYGIDYETDKTKEEKEQEEVTEDTEELFDMIDSMYKGGEE